MVTESNQLWSVSSETVLWNIICGCYTTNMKRIYLDNAATTKPDSEVVLAMNEVNEKFWGNASSIHSEGQEAKQILEESRKEIAEIIGCEAEEIIFTGGGTESDNLAIRGVVDAFYLKYHVAIPHVITSAFEHHAVLDTVKKLEKAGIIEATYIKPNHEALIDPKDVEAAIKPNTILVSIMYVNNEVGTVQPIREIGKIIKSANPDIYFHTDAVQAVEYFDINTDHLGVDLMSLAAHKFHGPKGVGLLYVRKGTPLVHQQIGGGQERKRRAGTENVAGIKGMSVTLQLVKRQKDKGKRIKELRDKLIDGILKNIPDTILNGSREFRSPANANITFKNAEGESIIMMLDMAGVAVSSGSACTSGSLDPSHVLLSMGIPAEEAHGSVRFTLSKHTTEAEIERVLEVLPPIIERLRGMSPFK